VLMLPTLSTLVNRVGGGTLVTRPGGRRSSQMPN